MPQRAPTERNLTFPTTFTPKFSQNVHRFFWCKGPPPAYIPIFVHLPSTLPNPNCWPHDWWLNQDPILRIGDFQSCPLPTNRQKNWMVSFPLKVRIFVDLGSLQKNTRPETTCFLSPKKTTEGGQNPNVFVKECQNKRRGWHVSLQEIPNKTCRNGKCFKPCIAKTVWAFAKPLY